MEQKIKNICGAENQRGEEPDFYAVGYSGVTSIERAEENLGTYGIVWLRVMAGEVEIARMNALHVARIVFH